ncbi:alpha-E domain-containing protein [Acinetobacter sp.]|uniref:alpha-E domain-containing protein n=1 Tax=Acinetobacter sp. TaxID=472 RepID=UPI00264A3F39|nr:alpha-E domain-containing protein [Acinetobacter sp.]MDN5511062.1 alpha-E domain-containing protein [Acinetobacter sp.]MDN5523730.1 alpha-E domain-containing protein [Acinetobacter sp.]
MILLNSNAQHIFWLGRYLTRIQYACGQFPFVDNQDALQYAHGFCLPAFDASSLNSLFLDAEQPSSFSQQFQYAKDNIQDLRGVLSAKAYAELNQLIKNAHENATYICDVAGDCHEVIEAESEDVFLFFSLGQNIEQLDRQIRLKQDQAVTLNNLNKVVELLTQIGWDKLDDAWQQLKLNPDNMNFYQFSDHIQNLFEVDV